MFVKRRFKNYGLWIAVGAFVLDLLVFQNVITPTDSEQWNGFIQRGLEILVLAGIVSNPTKPNSKGFNM